MRYIGDTLGLAALVITQLWGIPSCAENDGLRYAVCRTSGGRYCFVSHTDAVSLYDLRKSKWSRALHGTCGKLVPCGKISS
jgi:hypothetical protein